MHLLKVFISLLIAVRVLYPADAATLNRQGVEACNRKDFSAAVPLLTEALRVSPGNPTISGNLAAAACALAYEQDRDGLSDKALITLQTTLSLLPGNAPVSEALVALRVNLGSIALRDNDISTAQKQTDEALLLAPSNATALCLAGDIAYRLHDLPKAREYWETARKTDPSNPAIAQRLQRIGKEIDSERSFSRTEASHFDIRFDYRALGNSVFDIKDFLMEAYNRVGQDLGLFPEHTVAVVLYEENQFHMVNNVPEFVVGLYDGKIRVPVNFTRLSLSTLRGILFHEYTHAVIHALAGPDCPLWLNEGIAMREMNTHSPVDASVLRNALTSDATLSFSQLENRTIWTDPALVTLAYAQSWMMAEYLYYRWSNSQVKNLLIHFGQKTPTATILSKELGRTPEQFNAEWKKYASKRL